MTRQNYDLKNMESGQVNRAFENDGSVQPNRNNIRQTNGQLTSKVVEGPTSEREQWDKPIEFLLSCIAMSVGLGNIWRFPFTAYENGGGAFIIPYLIVLFMIGKPMYFLEMAVGQFSSKGQVKIWKMAPFFKGVGYGSAFGTTCVLSYYCFLMALTVFYFIKSFSGVLPWAVCNPEWSEFDSNISCTDNNTSVIGVNKSIPELYFNIDVLKSIDSIDDGIGLPDWKLSLCLLFSWGVILFSLIKGVQSAGKVAYFTALFPYVVLFTLLVRGLTLDGSIDGIKFLFEPKWEKLLEPKVWVAAVTQCFFSLSTGFGPIIMFSSYNPHKHNVYKDAFIISLMDTFTSLLAGVTIFSILGNLSLQTGVEISEVVKGGPNLAFVAYPDAIAKFDTPYFPQIFAVLFFLMLFTLGVGSASSLTNAVITVIHDQFMHIEKKWITTAVCTIGFFSGLIYTTPGGLQMLDLVDHFGAGFVIYIMATLEMIGICWFYGLSNVVRDIEFMLSMKLSVYWKFCWGFFIPIVLIVMFIYNLVAGSPPAGLPDIALNSGWILSAIALAIVPIAAIHTIATRKAANFIDKVKESLRPTADWGPTDERIREEWMAQPYKTKTSTILKGHWAKFLILVRLKKE